MGTVTFVSRDGTATQISIPDGKSVMQGAIENGVKGIVAECGGSALCATCHVYVKAEWRDRLPPRSAIEDAMLESTVSERDDGSRLSCQLRMSPLIDGLIVYLPEKQV